MIKKLLSAVIFTGSASMLSAAVVPMDDSILANVKQLSEQQMESVTGGYINFFYYYPSTDTYELSYVIDARDGHGYILVNAETGEAVENVWEGLLENNPGKHIDYTPSGYHE